MGFYYPILVWGSALTSSLHSISVWWFCPNLTKEFRLWLHCWNHRNTHKSAVTALSQYCSCNTLSEVFKDRIIFTDWDLPDILILCNSCFFSWPHVTSGFYNISLGLNKTTFCACTSKEVHKESTSKTGSFKMYCSSQACWLRDALHT